jgi:hypothetical protein
VRGVRDGNTQLFPVDRARLKRPVPEHAAEAGIAEADRADVGASYFSVSSGVGETVRAGFNSRRTRRTTSPHSASRRGHIRISCSAVRRKRARGTPSRALIDMPKSVAVTTPVSASTSASSDNSPAL